MLWMLRVRVELGLGCLSSLLCRSGLKKGND